MTPRRDWRAINNYGGKGGLPFSPATLPNKGRAPSVGEQGFPGGWDEYIGENVRPLAACRLLRQRISKLWTGRNREIGGSARRGHGKVRLAVGFLSAFDNAQEVPQSGATAETAQWT